MKQQVILCVDDEVIVLDALKEQLQQVFGKEIIVEIAESADEALDIFDEFLAEKMVFPVVIADFIMPGMNGDEFLAMLHKKSPLTKKIMLTGQASLEGVSNAVNNANLYRFISKPWDKDDLLLTIREAIISFNQEAIIKNQNEELLELNLNLEKKVEERTRQLQELNATKDKFFSIIAHDLKNPFNTMMGFTELLRDSFETFEPGQIKEYISILFETARSSYTLLQNLLEWARSQTNRLTLKPEITDLFTIVYNVVRFTELPVSKQNIAIENNIPAGTKVYVDVNTIETVLRNLISNAIKFSNNNNSIKIECSVAKNETIVCVSDNGVGISESNKEKLFRIDQNFSTKGTDSESGTGLGLILCKEFVEKNHGKIWVESASGKGSRFYFSMPNNNPEPSQS
ncbi:MAG: hybrid sensor histidine kinase/response regulator [Bacteroidales bacterium]|nr:hybrid sensor histidine kinase/response regulator [Bacteroidales bacterium]